MSEFFFTPNNEKLEWKHYLKSFMMRVKPYLKRSFFFALKVYNGKWKKPKSISSVLISGISEEKHKWNPEKVEGRKHKELKLRS